MSIGGAIVQVGGGGGGGGGITNELPQALFLLDFDAATFSDPNNLLTSWSQTSLGNVSVVYAGTLGSATPGFRPGASWTWALSDLLTEFSSGNTALIGEVFVDNFNDGTGGGSGIQLGIAFGDNATIALASGGGVEYYDSGTSDERLRAYTSTGENGNTGRAGLSYIDARMVPRPGSGAMTMNANGLATVGEVYQDILQPTCTAITHLYVTVGQTLANSTGTYTFSAKAGVLPWSGLRGA